MKKLFLVTIILTTILTSCNFSKEGTQNMSKKHSIDPNKPVIALTFDDGPNTTTTIEMLDKLEKYDVVASFFVIGNHINDDTKDVIKRAYDMGCEINNHSRTHKSMTSLTAQEIKDEVEFTDDKVYEITGERTKFFRPPYIATNDVVYDSIDMPFICGYGATDYEEKVSPQERSSKILEQISDGGIILLHDFEGNDKTVEAMDLLIPALIEQDYQFVTVSQLFDVKGVVPSQENGVIYTIVE